MPIGIESTIAEIKRALAEARKVREPKVKPPRVPEEEEIPGVTRIALQRLRRLKTPQVYTAELAREMGVEIDPDWLLKISPGRDGEEPAFSFMSPEGKEVAEEDILLYPEGRWAEAAGYVYDYGKREFVRASAEEIAAREEWPAEIAPEKLSPEEFIERETAIWQERAALFEEVYPELFAPYTEEQKPDIAREFQDMLARDEKAQEQFLETMWDIGRTPETERLLKLLAPGITEEDLSGIFPPVTLAEEIIARPPAPPEVRNFRILAGEVFPEYEINLDELLTWGAENPEAFIQKVKDAGPSKSSEALLNLVKPSPLTQPWYIFGQPGASFTAGVGDLFTTTSGFLKWLDAPENIVAQSREFGEFLQSAYIPPADPKDFTWRSMLDPEWWATSFTRAVPFTLALIPGAILAAHGGAVVATAAGLGKFGTLVLGALAATGAMRPMESAFEAGGVYNEMIDRGLTEEEADRAANETFWENMKLAGVDATQLIMAFFPVKGGGSVVRQILNRRIVATGAKVVGVGIVEAGEEGFQEVVQRRAMGDPLDFDPEMKEAMAIGAIFGAGLGGAGSVWETLTGRAKKDMTPEMLADFESTMKAELAAGATPQEAEQTALNRIAETPEGRRSIVGTVDQLKRMAREIEPAEAEDPPVLMTIPADEKIIETVMTDNWMRTLAQKVAKIPPARKLIEMGLGTRILVKRQSDAVEDIVGRGRFLHSEISRRAEGSEALVYWRLAEIERNPIKLFGFNKQAVSTKVGFLTEEADGTLEDIFTHPERYKLNDKQIEYVTRVHRINTQILNMLKEEGVAPENVGNDWWVHRVVVGRFDPNGELTKVRGRPGVKRGRIGAKVGFEMHRKAPTMADGIAWGIQYGRDPSEYVSTYAAEAFKKIADARFEKYMAKELEPLAKMGVLPTEELLRKYPEVVEKAIITAEELADTNSFVDKINRAIRGERLPEQTLRAIERRFPDLGTKFRALVEAPAVADKQLREIIIANEKAIRQLKARAERVEAIDIEAIKAEAREEAVRIGIPDEQKITEAFRLMEYDDRLAFRSTMETQFDDIGRMLIEEQAEVEGLMEWLSTDPVATYVGTLGKRKVHLDYFLKKGEFPESFTLKEAALLMQKPVEKILARVVVKGVRTDRVPREVVLDELTEHFKARGVPIATEDDLIEYVSMVAEKRRAAEDLKILAGMGKDRVDGIKRMLGILDRVDTQPELVPITEPGMAAVPVPEVKALTEDVWNISPIEDRASWAQLAGLEGKVGSKAWAGLTTEERDVIRLAREEIAPTLPEAGIAERERLSFLREDLARVEREAEAGTIPRPVANKQIEGLNLEIARLERELEGIPEAVPAVMTIDAFKETLGKVVAETQAEIKNTGKWLTEQRKQKAAKMPIDERLFAEEQARVASLEDRLPTLSEMAAKPEEYFGRLESEFPHIYELLLDRGRALKIIPRKPPAIPRAEPGMPEAGIQQDIFGYEHPHFPKGKGIVTQISMEDYSRLVELHKKEGLPPPNVAIKPKMEGVEGFEAETQIAEVTYEVPALKSAAERGTALKMLRGEVKALAEARRVPFWEARHERAYRMEQVSRPGIEEGYIMQPFAGGRIFDQEFIDAFNKFFGHDAGLKVLRVTADTAGILRILKAALDWSQPAIQGTLSWGMAHSYLATNPKVGVKLMGAWYKTFFEQIGAFFNPGIAARFMEANQETIMRRVAAGGSARAVFMFQEMQAVVGKGTIARLAEAGLRKIPLTPYQRAEVSFFAGGEIVRDRFWEIFEEKARAKGEDGELARFLDLLTGIADPRAMGVPLTVRQMEQSFIFFSTAYTRSYLTMVGEIFRGGMTGAKARRAVAGFVVAGAAYFTGIQYAISTLMGKDDDEAWEDVQRGFGLVQDPITGGWDWKPTAAFMSLKIGDNYFGIGGGIYGLMRLAGNIAATVQEVGERERIDLVRIMKHGSLNKRDNPFISWWYARSSALFSPIYEMATHRDFLGYPIETPEEYARYLISLLEPIWVEQSINPLIPAMAGDREVPENALETAAWITGEMFGLRVNPEYSWQRFYNKANEVIPNIPEDQLDAKQKAAIEAGRKLDWGSLTKMQKINLLYRYPELREVYEEAQADSELRAQPHWKQWEGRQTEERTAYYDRGNSLIDRVKSGELDTRELREMWGGAGQNYGAALDSIEKEPAYQEVYDFFDRQRGKGDKYLFEADMALAEYIDIMFTEYVDEKGDIDWDAKDIAVDAYIEKWGEEYYGIIREMYAKKRLMEDLEPALVRLSDDKDKLGRGYWRLPYKPIMEMDEEDQAEGNIPAEYFADWKAYQALETDEEREAFLEKHPLLEKDWRAEYRKENPEHDAMLALWGYGGKLLTREAYDLVTQWGKELGIPLEQMGLGLPPGTLIDQYFEYGGIVTETSGNSSEARLFRMEHPEWETWAEENWGWKPPDDRIEVLRINVNFKEQDQEYDAIKMDDEAAQREARVKYLEQNSDYAIARRQREAYLDKFPDELIDAFVEYSSLSDKGFWRKRFLLEHEDFYKSMLEIREIEELEPDKIPAQAYDEIYDKWHDLFDQYADVKGTATVREKFRAKLLEDNPEFAIDRRRREAYGMFFPQDQIENYAEYYSLERKGMEQELFLAEHPDFKQVASSILEWEPLKEKHIESLRISVKYRDMDDLYNSLGTREERAGLLENNPAYADARRYRDAYDYEFPDSMVDTYVEYYKVERAGYEDEWFLMEHRDFYETALKILEWKPRDFSKVPTREVHAKYVEYQDLIKGKPRDDYRWENRDLDAWLLLTGKVSVSITEKRRRAALTPQERLAEEIKEWEERLKREGNPQSSEEFGQSEESAEEGINPAGWREEYAEGTPHWATDMEPSVFAKEFVGTMESNKAESVLEIGCGNGRDSIKFAKSGFTVTSVDITPKAVDLAKKNAQKAKADINFKVANAEKLPFGEGEFDSVFTLSVLHSTELEKSLPELYRVLKPGGVAFVHIYADTQFKSGKEPEGIINYDDYLASIEKLGFEVLNSYAEQEDKFDEEGEKHSIFVVSLRKGRS